MPILAWTIVLAIVISCVILPLRFNVKRLRFLCVLILWVIFFLFFVIVTLSARMSMSKGRYELNVEQQIGWAKGAYATGKIAATGMLIIFAEFVALSVLALKPETKIQIGAKSKIE